MTSATLTERIAKAFPQLQDTALFRELEQHGSIRQFDEDTELLSPGATITHIPLVLEGSLKILRANETDQEILLYFLQQGETCAMSLTCCMAHKASEIRAVVEEKAVICFVPVKLVEDWMSRFADWKALIMSTYQFRFNELLQAFDAVAFKKMDERLLDYLDKKSQVHQGGRFIYTSHQEIAQELNSSREVISKLLKQLENQRKVKLSRNKIELVR